ncbi:RelA/SpoT family protein [Actinomyces sp. oral taxon 181]|jgi:relA/spoT family protein|uniref:Bifunctional (P)ppGpp synthase/hydrolase relA n=1 Tax=Schaalia odontolytica TaxID=1660 RepID=A0A6N2TMB6_9ACTO|nr:bifunctional (p)ppGpp synthetase/guanosine-3',5'-bis(diphosphate) 3'-pyrophosphohydrolase [Actinomyces sp. oral taxon 181]MBS4797042.1 bifunctional (p)ppGpp synthetase/guanosine-3',5'-bis(diphosphate) 3'-pyrophosphohydrolase [Actinomyces sp. oral taxon 181]
MSEQNDNVTRPPAAGSRVRSGLVWFGARSKMTTPEIEPLVRALRANHPKADVSLIERAYATAEKAHRGQMRKSGEPYITHPVAVATILAEVGMTSPTLAAALLHDTVEDTDYSLEQLTADFGPAIAQLVDGVTKLDKIRYGERAQSETLRKMIIAMSRDIRVLLIKLADRLHNARTWRFVPVESAKKKARETLEIYAPLAHRLGMNMIKWELEERSFKILYPEIYEEIDHLVAERAPERDLYLREVISQIEEDLRRSGTQGTVTGRPKNHYSIYQKMIVRNKAFDEIFDLVAVRVLVETVRDCYAVLGALHGRWNPIPGRFKDYIAMPKFNFYQSLHTTVIGPGGKPVEIQIRTYEMHEHAEHGVAAHWKYKQNPNANSLDSDRMSADEQMNWLRALVDMERETGDPEEFLDSLRYEISGDEVYVFTPKGEVVVLPRGATPVDFAYSVHTEVGNRTVGAKVNGRLVPLNTRLESGQTVEVVTSKSDKAGPSRDWLAFVASPRARSKIKAWFSRERKEEAVEAGKESIARAMRKQNLPLQRLMNHDSVLSVATSLGYPDISGLYAAVGDGHISAQNIVSKLVENLGGGDGTEETLSEAVTPGAHLHSAPELSAKGQGVSVDGMNANDVWVKLARCCTPVPGDDIVGFITRGQGVSVHQRSCPNAVRLEGLHPERFVQVSWSSEHSQAQYLVQIQTKALDRPGLLADLTKVMTEYRVNIVSASTVSTRDQVATARFSFHLAEMSHLNAVLAALRRVDGVFEAVRVSTSAN